MGTSFMVTFDKLLSFEGEAQVRDAIKSLDGKVAFFAEKNHSIAFVCDVDIEHFVQFFQEIRLVASFKTSVF